MASNTSQNYVYTVMTINTRIFCCCESWEKKKGSCNCQETHEINTISTHSTKEEAVKAMGRLYGGMIVEIPLPTGTELKNK